MKPALLEVRDLVVRFGGTRALQGVSLDVPAGSVTAVVGGDGAGKTTLLRAAVGRVAPTAGSVAAPMQASIGYLPATSGSWLGLSVQENVDFVGGAYGLRGADLASRAEVLLEAAGLDAFRGRLSGQLSGGMRRKLGVVLALLHDPSLLVLDEPSTGVDPVSRVDLWRLASRAAAAGAAVLMSTTYLDEAERARHVLVLDHGHPLVSGTPAQALAALPGVLTSARAAVRPEWAWRRGPDTHELWPDGEPPEDLTVIAADLEDVVVGRALLAAAHRSAHHAAAQPSVGDSAVARPTDTQSPGPEPAAAESAAAGPDGHERGQRTRRGSGTGDGHPALLEVQHLRRTFGDFVAVDDVSFTVGPGEVVGLLGSNGAGKTTALRMGLGLIAPSSGRSLLLGRYPDRDVRRSIGYVPQGLGLYANLSVAENIAFVADVYRRPRPAVPPVLAGISDALVGDISLGSQRELAFACALLHEPRLLVLDEPTSGVSALTGRDLWATIHGRAEAGVGVLVTTHNMQEAQQCDRLLLMSGGQLVGHGNEAELVAGTPAVRVDVEDWAGAFDLLTRRGLPVTLAGTSVRVAGVAPEEVAGALASGGMVAEVSSVPATIEERMVLLNAASAPG